jgi:hypothetical protein
MLIKLARKNLDILAEDDMNQTYSILRTHVYTTDGKTEFR